MKTRILFNVICNNEWVDKTLIEDPPKQHRTAPDMRGFSLVELMVVVTILALLSLIALPSFTMLKDLARNARAESEIRAMEKGIALYVNDNYSLPGGLAVVPGAPINDPWKNPYEYHPITAANYATAYAYTAGGEDNVSSDYDLYSTGKDGQSDKTLTTGSNCMDDIVRAGKIGIVALGDKLQY